MKLSLLRRQKRPTIVFHSSDRSNALERISNSHAPRGVFPPGGKEENQEYLEKDWAGVLVQHGNKSEGACRARGEKGRSIQKELRGTVGVRISHLFAQRLVLKAYSCRLGGAILEENHEAHASGPHVVFMGPQAYGIPDAHSQHSSSGLSNTRATTTSMDGSTRSASEVPRSPAGYHRGGLFNANASGIGEGYSPNNANHMKMIDEQFQACCYERNASDPRTPS